MVHVLRPYGRVEHVSHGGLSNVQAMPHLFKDFGWRVCLAVFLQALNQFSVWGS